MNFNPILIVSGEPNSVFLELFFKVFNNNKIKSPIILISSKKLLNLQMKKLGFKNKIRLINISKLNFRFWQCLVFKHGKKENGCYRRL